MPKQACPDCNSSDGCEVYPDGHTFCFSCRAHTNGSEKTTKSKLYIPDPVYKSGRGLSQETCKFFGYHQQDMMKWAPYYDQKGTLIGYKKRTQDKKFLWEGSADNVMLYGQQKWKKGEGRKVTVTEGEVDAMSIAQSFELKWPCVSVPNGAQGALKAFQENFEWLNSFDEIVIAFDNDEPGHEAAQECAELFSFGKVKMGCIPDGFKDANDVLKGAPDKVQRIVWDAVPFSPDDILCGEDLRAEIHKAPVLGQEIMCYPELSSKLKGFRKHEFYLFTAGSGLGKSTMVHEIAYELMQEHDQRIGLVCLEDTKRDTVERYLSINLNQPIMHDRTGITAEVLDKAYDETVAKREWFLYDHFGSLDCARLINKMTYMASSLEVDWIVLDHISIVVSGNDTRDERKDIDMLMTAMNSLIKKFDVGILAVVHLKRPDKGKSYNEGRQVSLSDLRGSAGLEQLSTAVIGLEGNQQSDDDLDKNLRDLRILKNRTVGWTGKVPGTLVYDPETGRLEQNPEECPFGDEGPKSVSNGDF